MFKTYNKLLIANSMTRTKAPNGETAYVDKFGKISQDTYSLALDYSEGLAPVRCKDKRWRIRDLNGNLSKDSYKGAKKFSQGFSAVIFDDGLWGYRDKDGNVSKDRFFVADTYCNGFAIVDCLDEKRRLRDLEGNLSEAYCEVMLGGVKPVVKNEDETWSVRNDDGSLGKPYQTIIPSMDSEFFTVQIDIDEWKIMDKDGKLSKETFKKATNYKEGYCVVKDEKGKYRFRDLKGKLSEDGYSFATEYSEGFAVVADDSGKFRYRNAFGELSEKKYNSATRFEDGCATVYTIDGAKKYIDINENEHDNPEKAVEFSAFIKEYESHKPEEYHSAEVIAQIIKNDPKQKYFIPKFMLKNEKNFVDDETPKYEETGSIAR